MKRRCRNLLLRYSDIRSIRHVKQNLKSWFLFTSKAQLCPRWLKHITCYAIYRHVLICSFAIVLVSKTNIHIKYLNITVWWICFTKTISGVYFACSMLLVSFSCLMTVVVLGMHYKGSHGREMPLIVRTIFFDYIAKFVCMNTVRKRANSRSIHPVSVRLF